MEDEAAVGDAAEMLADAVARDPERLAGRELRRLRVSQGWSQDEVARRMRSYGYNWHQTTIAKIEAASRPLRVKELADLAALFGLAASDILIPLPGDHVTVKQFDDELAILEADLARAEAKAAQASAAQQAAHTATARVGMLRGQISVMRAMRDHLAAQDPE